MADCATTKIRVDAAAGGSLRLRRSCGLVIAVLLLAACAPIVSGGTAWGPGAFESNGERIYFTATSERGASITYSGGPTSGMMMTGGNLTCASCHGSDGQGGRHVMHMQVMNAPDIRWQTLAQEKHVKEGEHTAYDLETFRLAVVMGEHPDGERLSEDMPRWQMGDADLADLSEFLKTLP